MRLAFWRIDLGGRGPGYALQDILAQAPTPTAKARLIAHIAPDVLVLSGLDYDHGLATLSAFRSLIGAIGHEFPHIFALPSNAGERIRLADDHAAPGPDETQGYGPFSGARGLALLSRFPIEMAEMRDFTGFLWRDLPDAILPTPAPAWLDYQHLSSTGHWDVPLDLGVNQRLNLLIYQAGPPVFGTNQLSNLDRNHDETAFWTAFLDERLPMPPPAGPFVVMGGSNLDPYDGDGRHEAMRALLAHPYVQDPEPRSTGATRAGDTERDQAHLGPADLDTVHWPQEDGPGNLRVSYILPSSGLRINGAGVFWPAPDTPDAALLGDPQTPPTPHRLVWVDLDRASLPPQPDPS